MGRNRGKKYPDPSVILCHLHLTHLVGQIQSEASWLNNQDDAVLRGTGVGGVIRSGRGGARE